jgi:CheY-like chemotaxis protein
MITSSKPVYDPSLKGARILVVEDEWMISNLIGDLLCGYGCQVVGPAAHVKMANDLATTEAIDCALLDLNVAGEPVFPTAKILDDRGIPFVFVSGYRRNQLPVSFRDRPMLQKPFSDVQLQQILENVLKLSGQ